ncbi:MAG: biopolymer transporter ExbD [Hyphomicrobium sp.]
MAMAVGGGGNDDGENSYKPMAEINVTPFVDVMLVLLIIFMVAAPLMVQGVPVDLPKTSASKLGTVKKPMVVTMASDGNLYIRDEQVTKQTLVSRLMAIKSQEGAEGIVYVRADKKIAYGDVMEILGRVGESGFARVSLLSQPSPGSQPTGQN